MNILLLGVAGGFGVILRFLIDKNFLSNSLFPASTFLINILGSFWIGVLFVLGAEKNLISRELAVLLTTGFLGGFTTFSAYALQTMNLAKDGNFSVAILYFLLSPLLSLGAVFLGYGLTRLLI